MTENYISEEKDILKVVFVLYIGTDTDGKNIYKFLFSYNTDETFAEGWSEKPSCNEPFETIMIDDSMYVLEKELRTDIKLDLAYNNCCFSMQDCRDNIVSLAYENLDEAEEYPEPCRIVIHFGDDIDSITEMFGMRGMILTE